MEGQILRRRADIGSLSSQIVDPHVGCLATAGGARRSGRGGAGTHCERGAAAELDLSVAADLGGDPVSRQLAIQRTDHLGFGQTRSATLYSGGEGGSGVVGLQIECEALVPTTGQEGSAGSIQPDSIGCTARQFRAARAHRGIAQPEGRAVYGVRRSAQINLDLGVRQAISAADKDLVLSVEGAARIEADGGCLL